MSDVGEFIRLWEEAARRVLLFDVPRQKVYGIEPGRPGRFLHSFGGPARHRGAVPARCRQPLHLVYTLDLSDRRVGVTVPGVRLLPLYHGFVYENCALGYRVVSDEEIEVLHLPSRRVSKDFPDRDYPREFAPVPVVLRDQKFDRSDPEDILRLVGVFGVDRVPEGARPALRKLLKKEYREYAALFETAEDGTPDTLEGLARPFDYPFQQGRPDSPCPDPRCENHGKASSMHVLALVGSSPVPGVALWGESGEGVQLIFEICPLCRAICTSNQCD